MCIKNLRTIAIAAILTLAAHNATAQDLLARQAPIDRKARAVDTLSLQRVIDEEVAMTVAADLYDTFENTGVHNRAASLPDNFRIDLRDFTMPTPSRVVTSNYGPRWGRRHEGLDIKVYTGDSIRSAFSGKVRIVKFDRKGYGKYVVVRHPNGLETVYGHLSKQLVKEGQELKSGDVIGLGGSTGRSSGSHLHFETLLNGVPINPALMFDFRMQDITGDFYTYSKQNYSDESAEATKLRGKMGNGGYTPEMVRGDVAPAFNPAKESASSSASNAVKQYHKVKKGETLSAIARKRHTTVDRLCRLNGIKKKATLRPGQILRYS